VIATADGLPFGLELDSDHAALLGLGMAIENLIGCRDLCRPVDRPWLEMTRECQEYA
jgi:hypothetical protein